MLVAMQHIEFIKWIPTALEQDFYFDVKKQNLIVFDDQMIDASKALPEIRDKMAVARAH